MYSKTLEGMSQNKHVEKKAKVETEQRGTEEDLAIVSALCCPTESIPWASSILLSYGSHAVFACYPFRPGHEYYPESCK
ncbi:hypothetical protein K469DRAFT_712472 [Zopfia rhizophila CBS 207.26]|uniref:Uncharacterized protein n=1 Tax=Zopfia rhizophila CBS 207.26 TaxID=1314779 RepID=A0A6A6DTK7_9PEZI|nr:hypothetical protein K469DRAFT_713613 [Zopfia rhizophila CBS 207.26]KAF2193689.1 hypothetical protein K469DRAFT_712472 [Zopfia rhizophila CBS 207.26]